MRIVIISEFFPESENCEIRGGVEGRAYYIAKELSKNNDVLVISSLERGLSKISTIGRVRVLRVGPRQGYTQNGQLIKRFCFIFAIIFVKLPWRPQVIDSQSIITYVSGFFLAKKFKSKKVITLHDSWIGGQWIKLFGVMGYIGEFYERLFLSFPWDGVITNSESTKIKIRRFLKKSNKKVIYNGINPEEYRGHKKTVQKNKVCFIGRLVKYKRVDSFLNVIEILKKRGLLITAEIVGDGPEKGNLMELSKRLNIDGLCTFYGRVKKHKDVLKILANCDLFTLPSEIEGFGIVTVEAAAMGKPFVSRDIPATREVSKNGEGGILFSDDLHEYANAIERLLTDVAFYEEKKREALNLSKKYFWSDHARETLEFYKEL